MGELDVHEALFSLRAMRRLRPDPVPEADLAYLVEAATQAPSGTNAQRWAFVVVTDPETRRRLGEIYRELGERYIRDAGLASGRLDESATKVYRNALWLVDHLGEAPALILACVEGRPPREPAAASTYYGSIFPAIQNLMLAARARGLGSTLTTLHKAREGDVRAVLGIPDHVETVALIPVGYPRGRFGRPLRRPAWEVTHWDRWQSRRAPT